MLSEIENRRSIRKYSSSEVEKEKILQSKKQYESSINTASKPEEETKEGNIEEEKQESEEKLTLEGKTLLSLGDGVSKVSTYQEKVKNLLN